MLTVVTSPSESRILGESPRIDLAIRMSAIVGIVFLAIGMVREPLLREIELPDWVWKYAAAVVVDLALTARFASWGKPKLFVATFGILYVAGLGPGPVAAVVAMVLAACALGNLLLGDDDARHPLLAVVVGFVSLALPFDLLSQTRANSSALYGILLLSVIVVGRRHVKRFASDVMELLPDDQADRTTRVAQRFALWTVALATSTVLLPTFSFDDRTHHLALGTQLVAHGRALFDVRSHVGAVSSNAHDMLYAIPHVLTRVECRGAINLAYFLGIAGLASHLLDRVGATARSRYVVLAAVFATPLVHALGTTMQTEVFTTLLSLAAAVALARIDDGRVDGVWAVVVIAAGMFAVKITGAAIGLPVLVVALVLAIRRGILRTAVTTGRFAFVAIHAVALAFHTYVHAYLRTGNPVFPYYNAIFRSPYYPSSDVSDPRYVNHFSSTVLYEMTFDTSRFYESPDGTLGFQFLALGPPLLTAAGATARRVTWWIVLVPGLIYAVVLAAMIQYTRYMFPGLVLATVALGLVLVVTTSGTRRLLELLIVGVTILNLAFVPVTTRWFYPEHPFAMLRSKQRRWFVSWFGAESVLNGYVNATRGHEGRVLYASENPRPFGADLHGTPIYTHWYNPGANWEFGQASDELSMRQFLLRRRVTHVVLDRPLGSYVRPGPHHALAELLIRFSDPVMTVGEVTLHEIRAFELRGRPPLVANPTFADEARGWDRHGAPVVEGASVRVDGTNFLSQRIRTRDVGEVSVTFHAECDAPTHAMLRLDWTAREGSIAPYLEPIACEPDAPIDLVRRVDVPERAIEARWYLVGESAPHVTIDHVDLVGVR